MRSEAIVFFNRSQVPPRALPEREFVGQGFGHDKTDPRLALGPCGEWIVVWREKVMTMMNEGSL